MAPRVQLVSTLSVFRVSIRTLSPRNLNSYSTKLTRVRPMHTYKRVIVWVNLHCPIHFPCCNLKSLQLHDCPYSLHLSSVQSLSGVWLCDPMDCSTPGLPVHHQFPGFTQTHAHWVGDAIQSSHPLSSPSPPTFNLSQHQGLFKWVSSLHHMSKVLEFQLQHQSFQWIDRIDFL